MAGDKDGEMLAWLIWPPTVDLGLLHVFPKRAAARWPTPTTPLPIIIRFFFRRFTASRTAITSCSSCSIVFHTAQFCILFITIFVDIILVLFKIVVIFSIISPIITFVIISLCETKIV